MARPGVLLYEPRHGGARLPLSLLHVASALDARVAIVDGRLEMAPAALVSELAKDAICLGVTTPTGPALADALEVSRAAKSARKQLPVLWGGPHATFRPAECLATGVVDACVLGPGERTLAEVVAALSAGGADVGIPGLAFLRDDEVAQSLPRTPEDINHLPHADYGLVDLERHFRYRGARRVEVSTSRGGGGEAWSGLLAERVIAIVEDLALRHRAAEIVFVDQGFFADAERVLAIAAGILRLQAHLAWDASASLADLRKALAKLDWRLLKESGGRLVTIWVEGPPEPGLFEVAETLVRAGFEARARFVVGRPGEDTLSPREAYRAARGLLPLGPAVSVELRLFEPWPGCSAAEILLAKTSGASSPAGVSSWAKFEPEAFATTWLPSSVRRSVPRWSFYLTQAARRPPRRLSQRLLRRLARGRARVGFYGLDFERRAILLLRRLKSALSLRTAGPSDD